MSEPFSILLLCCCAGGLLLGQESHPCSPERAELSDCWGFVHVEGNVERGEGGILDSF